MTSAGAAGGRARPPRLDLVTPLPPVRSGIADYSLDLLPHLAARADVRLIRLPGQPVAPEIAAAWPFAGPEELGEGGTGEDGGADAVRRLPLYQMGNNRHHEAVQELAMRHPGVLTLHDVVLHHLLLDFTLGRGDFYGYLRRLGRDHGWIGRAAATAKRWGAYGTAPIFALPAHRALLRRQRGVLVHGDWAAAVVGEDEPELRVRVVPMGVPLPPRAEREAGLALRRRFRLPEDAPVVGSFGFQTPIKRTALGVRALAAPGLERAHLLVVGEEAPGTGVLEAAQAAGVAARVHVTGYLPFAEFAAAIAAADACLNLRYPTAGETSASLLRVMAAGRAAVVSDYAQFAELPDAIAVKVPVGGGDAEVAALAERLAALLAAPGRLHAMGEAARDHVARRHDPGRAAAAVLAACEEWAEAAPPDAAAGGEQAVEVPPPSSLVWGRLPGELEVRGAELPWLPGERRRLGIVLRNRSFARWLAGDRGPGGIAVVVKLIADGRDLLGDRLWLPLPRDLAPDEEARFEVAVRRPPGPPPPPAPPPGAGRLPLPVPPDRIRLWVEPHLFGGLGLSFVGGPFWERDI
jgi:glycosyltransferase involved in cell wall biosynthesis